MLALFMIGNVATPQESLPNPFELLPATANANEADVDESVSDSVTDLARTGSPEPESQLKSERDELAKAEADSEFDNATVVIPSAESSEAKDDPNRPMQSEAGAQLQRDTEGDAALNESDVEEVDSGAMKASIEVGEADVDDLLQATYEKAVLIDARGPIFGGFHWYLNQRLDRAESEGADLVIIRLTTPGGDLEYSVELARRLRSVDWAKVVVWIPEEAISGGAIISLGADRIFLRDGAVIGDAGPIAMNLQGQFEHAPEKIVSYLTGVLRDLAESGGRSPAVAEAMADRELIVYEATEIASGKSVYLTQAVIDDPESKVKYRVGNAIPESGQNRFLTVSADRAVELQLAEGTFANEAALLQSFQIERLERTEFTWVDRLVFVLNWQIISALLLIVGLIGLYLEFAAPGISVAGMTALLCFGLFFWSHFLGGTANWLDVVLFTLGIVCIICEIFVLPGFGVFGITGTLLVVLALVLASQKFVLPEGDVQWVEFRSNLFVVLGSIGGVTLLLVLQIMIFDSLPGLNRFRLKAVEDESAYSAGARSLTSLTQPGATKAVLDLGQTGVADSDLRPSGKVRIDDQLIDVITEGDYVSAGSAVQIIRIEGNRITVRKRIES